MQSSHRWLVLQDVSPGGAEQDNTVAGEAEPHPAVCPRLRRGYGEARRSGSAAKAARRLQANSRQFYVS
jgi:hypothetical protein